MTPMKAIRAKCVDCCCGNRAEVKACPARDCPLYYYRMGHRPPKPQQEAQTAPEVQRGTQTHNAPQNRA